MSEDENEYAVSVVVRFRASGRKEAEARADLIRDGMAVRLGEGMTPGWIVSTPTTVYRTSPVRVEMT